MKRGIFIDSIYKNVNAAEKIVDESLHFQQNIAQYIADKYGYIDK